MPRPAGPRAPARGGGRRPSACGRREPAADSPGPLGTYPDGPHERPRPAGDGHDRQRPFRNALRQVGLREPQARAAAGQRLVRMDRRAPAQDPLGAPCAGPRRHRLRRGLGRLAGARRRRGCEPRDGHLRARTRRSRRCTTGCR